MTNLPEKKPVTFSASEREMFLASCATYARSRASFAEMIPWVELCYRIEGGNDLTPREYGMVGIAVTSVIAARSGWQEMKPWVTLAYKIQRLGLSVVLL